MKKLMTLLMALFIFTGLAWGQLQSHPVTNAGSNKNSAAATATKLLPSQKVVQEQPIQPGTSVPDAWTSTWYFSQSPGTYTAISGGTTLGTTSNDENVFGPYNIGFTFKYNGTDYTQFSVATNGFIGMGGTVVTTATLPISGGTSNNVISALGVDLQGQTGSVLQYLTTGTAPNRTLIIQWSGYRKKSATGDNLNFQIRLNEINNSIVFSYGAFTATGTTGTAQVGIRGASNSDYNNRSVTSNISTSLTDPWGYSTAGTSNTASCRLRSACYPLTGDTYGWTPYAAGTATLPLAQTFDDVPTATIPAGWKIENTNTDGNAWMSSYFYPNSDPNALIVFYNSSVATNDWFFTPAMTLTAGKTYKVNFYYTGSGSYTEKLEVKYGTTNTGAGMTGGTIFTNAAITTGSYVLGTGTFTPATSGTFYVGWHCYSAADMWFVSVDDISIQQVFNDDVAALTIINPTKIPASQLLPWYGKVQNYGFNTETFNVATRLRENTVLSSTQTNAVTGLTYGSTSNLSGTFNLSALGASSTFDLSLNTLLAIDENTSNDSYNNYYRSIKKDTIYAWDDGTKEGSVGFNTASGWLGQLYTLSQQDTLTSISIKWGTIPGTLAGNSLEIYNTASGVPTTKFSDIVTAISLTTSDSTGWKIYKPSSPIILPAGTYWIGAHQSVTLSGTFLVADDMTGFNGVTYLPGFAYYSTDAATWTDYTASSLFMFNMIRPNFANVYVPFVANPTAVTATPVSSSEIDLTWLLNGNNNNVLLAFNTSNTFGTPVNGTVYSAGNTIVGGGTVLQYNNLTSYNHTGLTPNTTYYYKVWSYSGSIYSGGAVVYATTFCAQTPSPWTETFEATTFPPTCWLMNGGSPTWSRSTAASGYGTGSASAVADFFNITAGDYVTLFTMPFNAGTLSAPRLSFDYAYATYSGEADELDIYYSTDEGNTFTFLYAMPGGTSGILNTGGTVTTEFVPTSSQWKTKVLTLPSGTNMIAFNAVSAYGNDLYIDNVKTIEGLAHDVGTESINAYDVVNLGVTPTATVKNYGGNTETFTVTMTIGAYTSTKTVTALAPATSQVVTFDPWTSAAGTYSIQVCTNLTGDLDNTNDCKTQSVKVMSLNKQVYGYTTFTTTDNGPVTFNLNDPGTLTEIVNDYPVVTYPAGGTWANGLWYATIYSATAPFNLVTINPTTGARTVVGDMGVNLNGLSYNTMNGVMYGVGYDGTNSYLYSVNLSTAVATQIGSAGAVLLINLAINDAGAAYAVDIANNNLGTVNLTTGAFSVVGGVGFDAAYAQDMEFDRGTGELYMAAYNSATGGELRWVDKSSGTTLLIGPFQYYSEITGFAIPYNVAAPTVTTLAATDETTNGATLHGTVNANGQSTTVTFAYGLTLAYGSIATATPSVVTGSTDTPVSAALTGLLPNTTYHFKVIGTSVGGTTDGADLTFTTLSNNKTLNLSSVLMEGLYNGTGTLFQAQDLTMDGEGNIVYVGPKWLDGSADTISVELHAGTTHYDAGCDCQVPDYPDIVYSAFGVALQTDGTATVSIPGEFNGSYYLTIKQRNHITTVSALPVSFTGSTITYAFDALSQAYDGNMTTVLEQDGETVSPPLFFGGDVNQDGAVEAEDINQVGNDAAVFAFGYIPTDVFADGAVEANDINITGNNAAAFVYSHIPM